MQVLNRVSFFGLSVCSKSDRVTFLEDINNFSQGSGKMNHGDISPTKSRSQSVVFGKMSTKRMDHLKKTDAAPMYNVAEANKFVRSKVLTSVFDKAKKMSFAEIQAKRNISPGAGRYDSHLARLKVSMSPSRKRL